MKSDSFVRVLAGCMILLSVALAHFVSQWWLLLTCFVALNLIQSAFTGFCPPALPSFGLPRSERNWIFAPSDNLLKLSEAMTSVGSTPSTSDSVPSVVPTVIVCIETVWSGLTK